MREDLFTGDEIPIEVKSRLPSEEFFIPNNLKREQARSEARETLQGASVVVLGDSDADGFGALLAVEAAYGSASYVACGNHGSNIYLGEAIEIAAEVVSENAVVFIQDVNADEEWKVNSLPDLSDSCDKVYWFDHHQWPDESVREYVDNYTDYLEIDSGEDEPENNTYNARCSAQMVRDFLESNHGITFSDNVNEAIRVTAEYDLWRKRDERCEDLNDYAKNVDNPHVYVTALADHGADIMENEMVRKVVQNAREEQEKLMELAIERAVILPISGVQVAFTYGAGPKNDIADYLLHTTEADVANIIRPGGGISIRSTSEFPYCHEVAGMMDGGGHPEAAGAFPDVFNSVLDYAYHWTTNGEPAKERLIEVYENYLES